MKSLICLLQGHQTVCDMNYIVTGGHVLLEHIHSCTRCAAVTRDDLDPVEEEYALMIREAVGTLNGRQPNPAAKALVN